MAREKYQIIHPAFTTSWRFPMDTTDMHSHPDVDSVDPTLFADLPALPGIYRFFGEQEELLYVGKSINLRQRVKSHFSARHRDKNGVSSPKGPYDRQADPDNAEWHARPLGY